MIDEYIFIAILSFSFPLVLYFFFLPFFFFYFFLLWFYDFLLHYTYVLFFLFCVNLLCVLNLWLPCFTSMSISPITICLRKKERKEERKEGRKTEREREKEREVVQSYPTLCEPWTVAWQAPPSMGFSRQEYWSGLPFPSPGDLPNPGIKPRSPELQADSLPSEPPGNQVFCLRLVVILAQTHSRKWRKKVHFLTLLSHILWFWCPLLHFSCSFWLLSFS